MSQLYKDIAGLFKSSAYTWLDESIQFNADPSIKSTLDTYRISYTDIPGKSAISVERDDFPVKIYRNSESYLTLNIVARRQDAMILDINDENYCWIENVSYVNFTSSAENYYFTNALAYFELVEFFKSQVNDSDEAFHFVDYVNDIARKIVFTSLSDKGRLIIKYFNEIRLFNVSIDYLALVEEVKNAYAENDHFPKFLKNAIIQYAGRYDAQTRIYDLIENLTVILYTARVNFEIYLNNLSVDKIRKDYDEYKSKYFKDLSEIISNLTQKIIGLPIFIATILFAIDKLKINEQFLVLLIFVIMVTTAYLTFLLKLNFRDLSYVKNVLADDYTSLMENNFFSKFPEQGKYFSDIKDRISSRIKNLRIIIESYFWILTVSNIAIIDLILLYLDIRHGVILISTLISLFILTACRNSILNAENKDAD